MTVDSLAEEITPMARGKGFYLQKLIQNVFFIASVPDSVKKELLQHIRDYLDQKQWNPLENADLNFIVSFEKLLYKKKWCDDV